MIPISEYVAVKETDTLYECFLAFEKYKQERGDKRAHRDALVFSEKGEIVGVLTMLDIFLALEPTYKKILQQKSSHTALLSEYVSNMYREYDLWPESLDKVCSRAASLKVGDVIGPLADHKYVDADDSLDKALHRYVLGIRQPLLVRSEGKIVGVVRYGDLFEEVRRRMLACTLG
jgi:CBS domain-containing protein